MNSKPKKLIVYLDQNFISDIAKLKDPDKKHKVQSKLGSLFNVIKEGVESEKLISPNSWIQALETVAHRDPNMREMVQETQAYLGQISFKDPFDLRLAQFKDALIEQLKFGLYTSMNWKVAFCSDPDNRIQPFIVQPKDSPLANRDFVFSDLEKARRKGIDQKVQYEREIAQQRGLYLQRAEGDLRMDPDLREFGADPLEFFIRSDHFAEIPHVDIFCKLWSCVLADQNRNSSLAGDYNDIEMISCYMPYCHVLFTDNYMKTMIERLGLDVKYGCKVFSMKKHSLSSGIKYIQEDLEERKPVNSSLFSLFVVLDKAEIDGTSVFLDNLRAAKAKFTNTGKYSKEDFHVKVFVGFTDVSQSNFRIDYLKCFEAESISEWVERTTFAADLGKRNNVTLENVREKIKCLPTHLRGKATAIVPQEDCVENDFLYDIEAAIEKGLTESPKYGVEIVY